MYFYMQSNCAFYKLLEVQIMHYNVIGIKGHRFQLSVFGYIFTYLFLLDQDVVMS